MLLRDNWWVPAADQCALDIILREVVDLETDILPLTPGRRTAIQAGGNVGIWPVALAKQFARVVTVEPDQDNHAALLKNLSRHLSAEERANVVAYRAAFGAQPETAAIDRIDPTNIGAHQLKPGDEFAVVRIDSLAVDDCDLLCLDVEGYEHPAVLGAIDTIKRSWPTIVLELKGLGGRYGFDDEETVRVLADLGYAVAGRVHRDVIFVRRG